MFDIGGLLRGQVEDMEGERENNACFSSSLAPYSGDLGWSSFGEEGKLSKPSCL